MPFPFLFLVSIALLIFAAGLAGRYVTINSSASALGILIDDRNRMSLNRLQVIIWTILTLSTFLALLLDALTNGTSTGSAEALRSAFAKLTEIPSELIGLMGVSAASATLAGAVKDGKNAQRPAFVMGPAPRYAGNISPAPTPYVPRWMQMIFEEEGQYADQVISISKFQNLIITVAVMAMYVSMVLTSQNYPAFDANLVYLIGISHAGYIGGKVPDKP